MCLTSIWAKQTTVKYQTLAGTERATHRCVVETFRGQSTVKYNTQTHHDITSVRQSQAADAVASEKLLYFHQSVALSQQLLPVRKHMLLLQIQKNIPTVTFTHRESQEHVSSELLKHLCPDSTVYSLKMCYKWTTLTNGCDLECCLWIGCHDLRRPSSYPGTNVYLIF